MSKKVVKDLVSKLKLTPEQKDVYDEFYRNLPDDPYKTFNSQDEFDKYVATKVGETTKELSAKLNEYETKPLIEDAKKAYSQVGKENMFKYIQDKAFKVNEDGTKTFNNDAKKPEFWKKQIEQLEDKDNYKISSTQTPPFKTNNGNVSVVDKEPSGEIKTKTLFF